MSDTERPDETAALLVVAGLSSRMSDFKPLLPLGDRTIIETVVDVLQQTGIGHIVIVTGHRADELEQLLSGRNIEFIRNHQYETTQMFDSVRLGLEALQNRCRCFFFSPADIPLFRPHTLRSLMSQSLQTDAHILLPRCDGRRGHPVLIHAGLIDALLRHDGQWGLKGALAMTGAKRLEVDVPDPGILMDADSIEDYQRLQTYRQSLDCPDAANCRLILKWARTPDRIIVHSAVVAQVALELADQVAAAGHPIDRSRIESAAWLHDICRTQAEHAQAGARLLRELGYDRIADVVEVHMDVPEPSIEQLDERAIVYLADKLVVEDRRVDLASRFEQAASRFRHDELAVRAVRKRLDKARAIQERVEQLMQS